MSQITPEVIAHVSRPEWQDWLHARIYDYRGCWEWTRALNNRHYGVTSLCGTRFMVHRLSWVARNGVPIPDGLEIDHLCRNTMCCNPDHLEPVTHAENMRRRGVAIQAAKPPSIPHAPHGSIRVVVGGRATRYAVLFREDGKQTSRRFGTREEAEAFLATRPLRHGKRAA